jgi:hypothetical protein
MAPTSRTGRLPRAVFVLAMAASACVVSAPVRADFLDGVRKTFTNDLPHFFQDDIPCAFGGRPTSHTRQSCKSDKNSGKSDKNSGKSDKNSGASAKAGERTAKTTGSGR